MPPLHTNGGAPGGDGDGGAAALRISSTIGAQAGPLDVAVGALAHFGVWGGGMILGPLSLLMAPIGLAALPAQLSVPFAAVVAGLCVLRLPESPLFCRIYLRSASLLCGGTTLWVADDVAPELDEGTMICYHPHGVIPFGFSLNGAIRAKARDKKYTHEIKINPRVSGVQAPVLFRIPMLRQVLNMFGCAVPATKAGMYSLFKRKMSFGIIVGGSEDVAVHIRGRERIFLKSRAGFLKYAMQYGYKICIAYNFGESDLYDNFSLLRPMNMWLVKRFGFVLPVFWGRWWCPLLPRGGVRLNTVMGELMELPRIENPTDEQVSEWHGRYMAAVQRLFERHKHQFGYGSRELEIL